MSSDTLKMQGQWWFPNSDVKFDGELVFDPNQGGILKLFGSEEPFIVLDTSRDPSEISAIEDDTSRKLILGTTKESKNVTVVYSLPPSRKSVARNYYSFAERTFHLDFILLGIHFNKFEEIKFQSMLVAYSNFDKWVWDTELIGRVLLYPHKTDQKYIIDYYHGKEKHVLSDEEVSVDFLSYPSIQVDFVKENKISHRKYVRFTSRVKNSLDDYVIIKNTIADFFNFAITDPVTSLRMIGYVKIEEQGHILERRTEIFYRSTVSDKMNKVKVISPYVIRYNDFAAKSDEILKKWINLRTILPGVYDLYFGVMYNPDLYLSNQFLMLAEATATYVGAVIGVRSDSNTGVKKRRIDSICEVLDQSTLNPHDKDWATKIIKEKSSSSFKEKMSIVYEFYSDLLSHLSSVIGSKEEFASKVTSLRNMFTHGNIDYDKLDYKDLFWKCKDLQLILQLCILSEIGFSKDEIKTTFLIHKLK